MKRLKEAVAVVLFLLIAGVILHVVLIFVVLPTVVVPDGWTGFPKDPNAFTIVVLSDTQHYSKSYPEVFDKQTQWIVDNIEALNIVFVTHEGDVVDNWTVEEQWENANHSMSKLDGKVAWGILPGNHDGANVNETDFNSYFGFDRFCNESWYGGAYENSNSNNYQLFSAGGEDYLIFHLQYSPSNATLSWASTIIDRYPTKRVIVSTHYYLSYEYDAARSDVGEIIWETLVKPHADQVFLVLCGHIHTENYRVVTENGHIVCELLSDYQEESFGGGGWLKILHFSPLFNKVFVKTYSPYLNAYDCDSKSEYVLDYNMPTS